MVLNNNNSNQLLLLLLLMVANLPRCSSSGGLFPRPPRLLTALREARRAAHSGSGAWQTMDPTDRLANVIAGTAAKQANVTATKVLQAYVKVRPVTSLELRTEGQPLPH